MEVNAFILFGMPDENLRDVVNTMFYASDMVGGLVPMLFTPVPGSIMFEQYEDYLFGEMGYALPLERQIVSVPQIQQSQVRHSPSGL